MSTQIFEERRIFQTDGTITKMIIERVYDLKHPNAMDATSVEWWGIATINDQHGRPMAQKPYRIEASTRVEAFANAESTWRAMEKQALADLNDTLQKQQIAKVTPEQLKQMLASDAARAIGNGKKIIQ